MMNWSKLIARCVVFSLASFICSLLSIGLVLFWIWSAITDYSGIVQKKKPSAGHLSTNSRLRKHGFLQLNDVSIHYVEAGDKRNELILCLHGFPEFWYSWRHQIQEFSSTHWVVAVDLRGYGESDKPKGIGNYHLNVLVEDVRQIISALGKDTCILLCHDWGGAIGWQLATEYPNLVQKFIPMNSPHPGAYQQVAQTEYTQLLKSWYMIFFQLPAIPEWALTYCNSALLRLTFLRHSTLENINPMDTEEYLRLYTKPSDLTGPINYYRNLLDLPPPSQKRITVPTLLIWGTEDQYLNDSMASLSSRWVENFHLYLLPGVSHWVQQEAPEDVNKKIRQFLKS